MTYLQTIIETVFQWNILEFAIVFEALIITRRQIKGSASKGYIVWYSLSTCLPMYPFIYSAHKSQSKYCSLIICFCWIRKNQNKDVSKEEGVS